MKVAIRRNQWGRNTQVGLGKTFCTLTNVWLAEQSLHTSTLPNNFIRCIYEKLRVLTKNKMFVLLLAVTWLFWSEICILYWVSARLLSRLGPISGCHARSTWVIKFCVVCTVCLSTVRGHKLDTTQRKLS